ncbi:MAG: carboxymuconolactone decarboxylase family protein [Candidatus Latescibacteria bacterium]|nr:carboxymuconolactone decarboxylase family protein [Candidatus Latescibacterota bacterium]
MERKEDFQAQVGDYQRGIEVMNRLWGEETTARMRAIWKQADPEVERYITAFALGEVWARPVLDLKTRSLLCLAASVALERESQIRLHTHGALHSGATPAEIAETIIQLMIYTGFPAAWQAMSIASQIIAQEQGAPGL